MTHSALPPSPVSLLILEDNPAFLDLLREGLTYEGYDVATACSGKEGLQVLQTRPLKPHLILCDYHLADMTAADFLRAVYKDPHLSDVPAVIFSGNASSKCLCPGFETQIKAQLLKPFTLDDLISVIEMVLTTSHISD